MKHVMGISLSGLALAGLVAAPSFAATQSQGEQGGAQKPGATDPSTSQEQVRLELKLETQAPLAFRVERRSSNPLGAGGGTDTLTQREGGERGSTPGDTPGGARSGAAGMMEPDEELRFELRPQRASEQQGQTLIQVQVSKSDRLGTADRPGAAGGAGQEQGQGQGQGQDREQGGAQRSGSQAGMGETIASFDVLVDSKGNILRIGQSAGGAQTGGAGDSQAKGFGSLDPDRVRNTLAVILGSGLHDQPLRKGETYVLGKSKMSTPVEASAPKGGAHEMSAFELRFESARESSGGQPGAMGKAAVFTIVPADNAGRGEATGREREQGGEAGRTPADRPQGRDPMGSEAMTPGSMGRATYSLQDGLVQRFEVRPQLGAQTGTGAEQPKRDPGAGGAQQQPFAQIHKDWITIERISGR